MRGKIVGIQMMGLPDMMRPVYDVQGIGNIVDYITLVTYNFHTPHAQVTGHNSPMYSSDDKSLVGINVCINLFIYHSPSTGYCPITDGYIYITDIYTKL